MNERKEYNMRIQPTNNFQTNSFKALSTVRIPVNNANMSKLLVQVEHKGDFYALNWRKVIVNTLEKGKNVATKIFENKKSFMSLEKIAKINDYIDQKAGIPKDNVSLTGILMDAFAKQRQK